MFGQLRWAGLATNPRKNEQEFPFISGLVLLLLFRLLCSLEYVNLTVPRSVYVFSTLLYSHPPSKTPNPLLAQGYNPKAALVANTEE